jgi:hypothetical protein
MVGKGISRIELSELAISSGKRGERLSLAPRGCEAGGPPASLELHPSPEQGEGLVASAPAPPVMSIRWAKPTAASPFTKER